MQQALKLKTKDYSITICAMGSSFKVKINCTALGKDTFRSLNSTISEKKGLKSWVTTQFCTENIQSTILGMSEITIDLVKGVYLGAVTEKKTATSL